MLTIENIEDDEEYLLFRDWIATGLQDDFDRTYNRSALHCSISPCVCGKGSRTYNSRILLAARRCASS